jgi:hypothetical protein
MWIPKYDQVSSSANTTSRHSGGRPLFGRQLPKHEHPGLSSRVLHWYQMPESCVHARRRPSPKVTSSGSIFGFWHSTGTMPSSRGGSVQRNSACPPNMYIGLNKFCAWAPRGASAAIEHTNSSAARRVAPHRRSTPTPLVWRRTPLCPAQRTRAAIPRPCVHALPLSAARSPHARPGGAAARPHCAGDQPISACVPVAPLL